jgi:hypothetical protein
MNRPQVGGQVPRWELTASSRGVQGESEHFTCSVSSGWPDPSVVMERSEDVVQDLFLHFSEVDNLLLLTRFLLLSHLQSLDDASVVQRQRK